MLALEKILIIYILDNWMQPFGDRYVAGYSSKGHDLIDAPVYP